MIWKQKTIKDLLPPPVKASHGEYSMILSAHDEPSKPNAELLMTSLRAVQAAAKTDLSFLNNKFANVWPGEHYKLLAGFMQILKPALVIEIGTSTGLSALAMLPFFAGRLITFDVKDWRSYPDTALKETDFGRMKQVVADLSDPPIFEKHRSLIQNADFIFIDATHDGDLEKKLLDLLATVPFRQPPLLFFDDIRVWTMLKMWREIPFPKLDLTSFGHWSGTGIVSLVKKEDKKVVVYVKHYLTPRGIDYFISKWFPKVESIISKQPGFISIKYSQSQKERDLMDIELVFENEATLEAWLAVPDHRDVIKSLDIYRSRFYWKAVRTTDLQADPATLDWTTIELKQ
jgi:predicted O-methyltransferase YrrM/heme-degrading monooxygenase HmoA